MKTIFKYLPWAFAILFLLMWLANSCDGDSEKTVTVPAKSGVMPEVNNPVPLPPEKEYVYRFINRWLHDTIEIKTFYPVNKEKVQEFINDTTNQPQHYAEAIQEREYHIPQEDSVLKTDNYISARGEVLSFRQSYTIKPQKVKQKQTVFRMLGGIEAGNTLQFDNFQAKANIMLQNKKGNIFSISADTEQRLWVGYNFTIFSINK